MVTRLVFRNLLSVSLAMVAVGAVAQVQYRVTELSPLNGYAESGAVNINDRGDVVGSCGSINIEPMATVWRNGVPTALGRVRRGTYTYATAINNAGVVLGEGDDGDGRPNVVGFKGGSADFIDSGANNSHAFKVTTSGLVIGNYLKGFGGTAAWNPTIWTADDRGRYKHTFLPGYLDPSGLAGYVYANGANNQGVVVGQVSSSQWSARGGYWANDAAHTLTLLDPLPGQWDSYANGINDSGVVVGVSDLGSFSTTPVMWVGADHTPVALPLMPGEIHGSATAINNLGHVIGWHGSSPAVWIDGNLIDVQNALDASGAGWTLSTLNQINNLGQIVGTGMHNGKFRAFVLTPLS